MALIPLTVDEVAELISVDTTPTALQYAAYWGRTPRERYSRLVETFLVSILGMVFSYCLSFVLGGFVATILGAVFLFWGIFTPQLAAVQRNWEFLGGRQLVDPVDREVEEAGGPFGDWFSGDDGDEQRSGLYSALFVGRLTDACVVESALALPEDEYDLRDFDDYTMETDELEQYTGNPYLLRVRLSDEQGRALQVHARLSEEYLDLQTSSSSSSPGVVCLLLSKSPSFDQLAALTDVYVVDADIYIGDYPYWHREGLETLLSLDDDLWEALQRQVPSQSSSITRVEPRQQDEPWTTNEEREGGGGQWRPSASWEDDENDDDNFDDEVGQQRRQPVEVRRGRRPRRRRDEDDDGFYY